MCFLNLLITTISKIVNLFSKLKYNTIYLCQQSKYFIQKSFQSTNDKM